MDGKLISMMQLIIILLVGWYLGWPSGIALAQLQFSDAITGSANITDVGITCLINLAVFVTTFLRGRLFLEMGARDVMATIIGPTKLKEVRGVEGLEGLRTDDDPYASVVMLSSDLSNPSMRLFMRYMYNTYDLYSILLKYVTPGTALKDPSINFGNCSPECNKCNCIVLWRNYEITKTLVSGIPKMLKALNESHCLLPCEECRKNGCHECNQQLLYLDDSKELATCNAEVESSAICEALDIKFEPENNEEPICICIPLRLKSDEVDEWTRVLVKTFKSKDMEDRGTIVMAPIILEKYVSMNGENGEAEICYNTTTFIVPRIVEILVNVALTFWLKLDGFSSALVARKVVRSHIVDSTGNGFAANAFLTAVHVNSVAINPDDTTVCQKLSFRGGKLLTLETLSFLVGLVNLICSLGWAVFVALGVGAPKLCRIPSMLPSLPRLAVAMAAIFIGLGMDCFELYSKEIHRPSSESKRKRCIVVVLMIFEILYIVTGIAVARTWGIKRIGRWVYSALQMLVWVKWGVGCYLLGEYSPEYAQPISKTYSYKTGSWVDVGTMVYSSSFLLNAVSAGVRGWEK